MAAPTPQPLRRTQPVALVVDDDEPSARMVAREVRAYCEVATAFDGVAGFEAALELHPRLIISDVHMPLLDGLSMVRRIEALPACRGASVIFMTADTDPSFRLAATRWQHARYLVKPISIDRLHDEVRWALAAQLGDVPPSARRPRL